MKKCSKCKELKPIENFSTNGFRRGKVSHRSDCKECRAETARQDRSQGKYKFERSEEQKSKHAAYMREYSKKNRDRINAMRRARYSPERNKDCALRTKYGISLKEYNRMFEEQKGKCAICGVELDNGFFTHLDHDHDTGRVRGLLCRNCNPGLGQFKHSAGLLQKAVEYLKGHK